MCTGRSLKTRKYILGNSDGVFDAGPDGRTTQIVTDQPEIRNRETGLFQIGQPLRVTDIVLG